MKLKAGLERERREQGKFGGKVTEKNLSQRDDGFFGGVFGGVQRIWMQMQEWFFHRSPSHAAADRFQPTALFRRINRPRKCAQVLIST